MYLLYVDESGAVQDPAQHILSLPASPYLKQKRIG